MNRYWKLIAALFLSIILLIYFFSYWFDLKVLQFKNDSEQNQQNVEMIEDTLKATDQKKNELENIAPDTSVHTENKITLINGITDKMLEYAHWSGRYSPNIFVIRLGEKILISGESIYLELPENREIVMRYDYSFANGYKTGARLVHFIIPPDKRLITISFSWKKAPHLILDDIDASEVEVFPFDQSVSEIFANIGEKA